MNTVLREYAPPLPQRWLAVVSDLLVRLCRREEFLEDCLVKQAGFAGAKKMLHVGCRAARLAMLMKKAHPEADVIGIAGDRVAAETARAQAQKQGVNIPFFDAQSFDLPCRDSYFDRVFSSMLFHPLTTKDKIITAKEMYRVLKPGGELHVADFGKPQNTFMSLIGRITRKFEEMDDNIQGLLPHILYAADFEQIEKVAELMTIFGTVSLLRARKPA